MQKGETSDRDVFLFKSAVRKSTQGTDEQRRSSAVKVHSRCCHEMVVDILNDREIPRLTSLCEDASVERCCLGERNADRLGDRRSKSVEKSVEAIHGCAKDT